MIQTSCPMVVLAVAVFVALSSCAVGCTGSTNSTAEALERGRSIHGCATTVAAVFKEMESVRCEQTTLQQQRQQNALTQIHIRKELRGRMASPLLQWKKSHETIQYDTIRYTAKAKMPQRCTPVSKCGTHSPLWLAGEEHRHLQSVFSPEEELARPTMSTSSLSCHLVIWLTVYQHTCMWAVQKKQVQCEPHEVNWRCERIKRSKFFSSL